MDNKKARYEAICRVWELTKQIPLETYHNAKGEIELVATLNKSHAEVPVTLDMALNVGKAAVAKIKAHDRSVRKELSLLHAELEFSECVRKLAEEALKIAEGKGENAKGRLTEGTGCDQADDEAGTG